MRSVGPENGRPPDLHSPWSPASSPSDTNVHTHAHTLSHAHTRAHSASRTPAHAPDDAHAVAQRSLSCTSRSWLTAIVVAGVWTSSLLTFALGHVSSTCALASHDLTFAVAAVCMCVGAVTAGYVSDRLGRLLTLRLTFALGCFVALASAVVHAEDTVILVCLSGVAGVAAGATHTAAELLTETLPPRHRAWTIVCYPAVFFPVGAVVSMMESVPVNAAITIVIAVVACTGVGLVFLRESDVFTALLMPTRPRPQATNQRIELSKLVAHRALRHPRGQTQEIPGAGAWPFRSPTRDSPAPAAAVGNSNDVIGFRPVAASDATSDASRGLDASDTYSESAPLTGAVAEAVATDDSLPQSHGRRQGWRAPCSSRVSRFCERFSHSMLIVYLCCMWLLLTLTYYVAGLAFYVPSDTVTSSDAAACDWRFAPAGAPAAVIAPSPPASAGCAEATSVAAFRSGAHVLAAEILAVWCISTISNAASIGRRGALALACIATCLALVLAAFSMRALGCEGTGFRAFIEFSVRFCMASCTQSLFLFAMEALGTQSRSLMMGSGVATFRAGALLTLVNTAIAATPSQLQWSVYALQQPYGDGIGEKDGAANTVMYGALLGLCAIPCAVAAVLTWAVPVDTRMTSLRRTNSEPFVKAQGDDAVGPLFALSQCLRAVASTLRHARDGLHVHVPLPNSVPERRVTSRPRRTLRTRISSSASGDDESAGLIVETPAANAASTGLLPQVDDEDVWKVSTSGQCQEDNDAARSITPTLAAAIARAQSDGDAGFIEQTLRELHRRERSLIEDGSVDAAHHLHHEALRLRLMLRTMQAASALP